MEMLACDEELLCKSCGAPVEVEAANNMWCVACLELAAAVDRLEKKITEASKGRVLFTAGPSGDYKIVDDIRGK